MQLDTDITIRSQATGTTETIPVAVYGAPARGVFVGFSALFDVLGRREGRIAWVKEWISIRW